MHAFNCENGGGGKNCKEDSKKVKIKFTIIAQETKIAKEKYSVMNYEIHAGKKHKCDNHPFDKRAAIGSD